MRVTCLLFFIIISTGQALGQSLDVDSLKSELRKAKIDSLKVQLLNEIAITYLDYNTDSAKLSLDEALQLSQAINFLKGQAIALNYLGRYHSRKGNYFKAAEYFLECLNRTGYYEENRLKALTYYDLGQLYSTIRSLSQSDELFNKQKLYFEKSIETLQLLTNPERRGDIAYLEAAAYTEIGRAYIGRKTDSTRYDSAMYYFSKAYEFSKEVNTFEIMFPALESMGNVYLMRHQYDEAVKAGHQLLVLSKERIPYDHYLPMSLMNLGQIHRLDSYDSAVYYLKASLNEFNLLGDQFKIYTPIIYDQLGQLDFRNKHYAEAIKYFDLVRETSKKTGHKDVEIAYLLTSESYKALGNFKKALEFQTAYYELKDSLLNEDTSAKLARLQGDFESAHQLRQIELLEKEAEVKELLLINRRNQQVLIGIVALLLIILSAILIIRNRSIQKRKEEQENFFREIDQLKSRFFANISHEFRTPLTLLLGPIEKRLAAANNEDDKTEFSVMHRSASRLLRLVNQLLDLSRFEAGTIKLQASQRDLIHFITNVMSEFQSIADSKKIQFNLRAQQEAIDLYFDPDKMEKMLNNLFSNAFKFTREGGEIMVEATPHSPDQNFENGFVEIAVKDTGIGIAPEHLPKLFDRFYQVDNSTTREFEGSGIGLALTKELVEVHLGRIHVESSLGVGSKFIIQLPMGNAHLTADQMTERQVNPSVSAPQANESSPVLTDHSFDTDTILIIEDNADLREHLRRELISTNRVVLAKDGEEGVQIAIQEIPSLIISDLMMPRKDGIEVCAIVKEDERTSHIPFILLTAKTEVESRLDGFRKGADDYIAKPFSMIELKIRIQNIIGSRKKLQKKYAQQVINIKPGDIKVESVEEKFLLKVSTVAEKYLADPNFGVDTFSKEIGMSHAQLYRKMTALTNYSPNEFIRHMRLQRAADLLRQHAGNIAEVAYQTGFNNLSYFSKVFKDKFGVTPSDFSKNGKESK